MADIRFIKNIICFSIIFITCTIAIDNASMCNALSHFYKDKHVLVTGGCGFIGSHLVEELVNLGAHVSILDDITSGKLENIEEVRDKVVLFEGSIVDYDICNTAVQEQEIIFHLAAFVSVPMSVANPKLCHDINVLGLANMLEAARYNGVQRFVFSSSSAVYGECDSVCTENTAPAPASPYGFSKLIGEMLCTEYACIFDMETVMLRYFNVYGERQDPYAPYAGVVAKFMYNMEHDLPLIICGDGLQTRDFIPVKDVVQANLILGMLPKNSIQSELFNIASGKSINLFELIQILQEKYPLYHQDILFAPERAGDVKNTSADCKKYYNLLFTYFS